MTKEAFDGHQETFGYSQAMCVGDTIYVAGTLGVGEGLAIPEGRGEQTTLGYANIAETLAHFGADMSHVVEQSVFVTDTDAAIAARAARKLAFPGEGCVDDGRGDTAGSPPGEGRDKRDRPRRRVMRPTLSPDAVCCHQ